MVRLIILLLLPVQVFSLDGTITVLEAPIFAKPDEKTKVVQYYRKGDSIYIHPQEGFKDNYIELIEELTPGVEADLPEDPLFGEKPYFPEEGGKFYKTISRNGKSAYVLKEHVILNFKDRREFNQKVIEHDHTDYRIAEPLPKNYPFDEDSGYKGQSQLAIGKSNFQAYPYSQDVFDTEINFSKEFNFIWSSAKKVNKEERFFFGVYTGMHFASVDYLLNTQKATQENIRLSLGPLASYDLLRDQERGLNVYLSIQAHLLDQMKITIKDPNSSSKEVRNYSTLFPISSVLGINYQFYETFSSFDTVLGTNVRFNLPKTYTANDKGSNSDFWQKTNETDNFHNPFTTEVNFYFGLQSYY